MDQGSPFQLNYLLTWERVGQLSVKRRKSRSLRAQLCWSWQFIRVQTFASARLVSPKLTRRRLGLGLPWPACLPSARIYKIYTRLTASVRHRTRGQGSRRLRYCHTLRTMLLFPQFHPAPLSDDDPFDHPDANTVEVSDTLVPILPARPAAYRLSTSSSTRVSFGPEARDPRSREML